MKTFLRNIRSGEYLQSFETWTMTASMALDFESVSRALDLVRRRGLKDMELVLADDPARLTAVPVAKLPMTQSLTEDTDASRRPRAKRLDTVGPRRKTSVGHARTQRTKPALKAPASL
jgi:hypothetical protein